MKNAIYREKERLLALEELGDEILSNARNELYLSLHFLDRALSGLRFAPSADVSPAATDGRRLLYKTDALIGLFTSDPRTVNRLYLHLLMHCLFGHLFAVPPASASPREWIRQWNLACDITAEYLTDGLYLPCLMHRKSSLRLAVFQELKESGMVVTAQNVLRWLKKKAPDGQEIQALEAEFFQDDHHLWFQPSSPDSKARDKWDDIREKMQSEFEIFSKEASSSGRVLQDQVKIANRKRYDYRRFLRRFSVLREEMQVDPDSFDYIYYHYGMELYHNMPLIEPLETKEVYRIEEFVIVIDTSMSCDGFLVRRFLEETWSVLSQEETYARKFHIRIIQCDEQVRADALVTNTEELNTYMKAFTVAGKGGTDFRPAFAYVNALVQNGAFHHLKGLIYFTDGYGIYPVKRPVYDTAFVFLKEDYQDVDVPPWAMKIILDPAEDHEEITI